MISTGDCSQGGWQLTSLRGCECSKSVHKCEDTRNRLMLSRPRLLKRACKEKSYSAFPHLISVGLVGSIERAARVWPFRPARNRENCILCKTIIKAITQSWLKIIEQIPLDFYQKICRLERVWNARAQFPCGEGIGLLDLQT